MSRYSIDIEPRLLHFKQPAGTSRGVYRTRQITLLHVTDPERPGIRGTGECAPLPDLSCDACADYADYLAVVRRECEHFCASGVIDHERLRPYPSILFGLETAVAQLQAGGSRCLWDSPFGRGEQGIVINGLIWMGTYDEMRARLEEKLAAGFRCIKLKIGAIDFESEMELVRRIRADYSRSVVELRVDANGAFAPQDAMHKLETLAKYDIHSIEQPIRQGQWTEMARLCRETPLPIALDEELIGVNDPAEKERLLDTIRPQYIILKPSLHGGMHGSREWIDMARSRGMGSWITSALESNVGLNAVAHMAAQVYGPDCQMPQGLGTGQLFTDNTDGQLEIRGERLFFKP